VAASYIYHQLRIVGPTRWLGNLKRHVHNL